MKAGVVWGQNQGARIVSAKALRQSRAHHTPAMTRRPVWPGTVNYG